MATLTALLISVATGAFSGCGGITPPETPRTLAVDDFPNCVVRINGEQISEEPTSDELISFEAGETLNVEVELTLREGLEQSQLVPGIIHLMMAANDDDGEEMASFIPLYFEESNDDAVRDTQDVVRMVNEWPLKNVEPGTYELLVTSGIEPMGSLDAIPVSPVFSTTVVVR